MPASSTHPAAARHDSMVLLRSLVEDSLDDGYARAAARRRAAGPTGSSHRATWWLVIALAGVGLLLATAFAQTRDRAGSVAEARAALVGQAESRAEANERAQADLDRQRATVAREQRRALEVSGAGSALLERLADLEATTGTGPVSGPGIVVQVDDAPVDDALVDGADVDPRTQQVGDGRVTDRDLQTVVNEIWAAGAEAVAVNGQRLTALSAIRSAGEAVLVDFRPLTPPYDVEAIGDPEKLRSDFVDGFGGSYLQVLEDYGITSSVEDRDRLSLPASAGVTLRFAAVPPVVGEAGT